jgi:asparagine synthase (glutamine-hydrolysing)
MCGIAGLWNFARQDIPAAAFDRFTDSLQHRGPDGRGVHHDTAARLWLGHRRLAILDLTDAGAQPMASENGRYWVIYNGEIYNFLELQHELHSLGHHFRGHSDTEVLVAAYKEWGEACQLRFNGMWAFAIWDSVEKYLFLSRDRFGIKPLHYYLGDDCFAFASELKAFLQLQHIPFEVDEPTLASAVQNMIGLEGTDRTWCKGVSRLPGGHSLTVWPDGNVVVKRWWDTLDHLEVVPRSYEEQVLRFRELFFDACKIRMRSDVPLATSLSGGLDSSAVFCTLHHLGQDPAFSGDWQRAFIAGFKGTEIDERAYAMRVVDHVKAKAVITEMEETAFLAEFEKLVFHFEEVNSVLHAGMWLNYKAMRDHGVLVSLDGHGADEYLGGYHFIVDYEMHRAAANLRFNRFIDLRDTFAGFAGGSNPIAPMSIKSALRYAYQYSAPARKLRIMIGQGANLPPIPARAPLTEFMGNPVYEKDERFKRLSGLGKNLYIYFHYTVLPSILRNFDRASMGNGIETRMPFMDWRLVCYLFSLPDEAKMGHGYAKRILRDAMEGIIPDNIRLRTNKIGFTSPMGKWLTGGLRNIVKDTLTSQSFGESNLFSGKTIRDSGLQLLEQNNLPGFAATVWPAVNAHLLARQFQKYSNGLGR